MLEFEFMQRALLAGVLVGLLCAVMSFFVVLRKMSFVGVGLSHASFGGVALAVVLGWPVLPTAAAFGVLVALAIGWAARHGRLHQDAAIGILFSLAMALGVLLIGLAKHVQIDVFALLFGNILTVSRGDLWLLLAVAVLVLGLVLLTFRHLLFLTFDEELARASGLPTGLLDYGLLTLLALTIVVSIRVVGIVLVESLLVIPAVTGLQASSRYRMVLLAAIASGVLSTLGGLALSYRFDLASGAAIVIVATAGLVLTGVIARLRVR